VYFTNATASLTFDAAGFAGGCVADFSTLCAGKQCGGLGCGACDDRTASCDALSQQCVSFCLSQNKCGGVSFTNPLDYTQVCEDTVHSKRCPNGNCVDLTSDKNNCGASGNLCAVGASCVASSCQCPTGQSVCSAVCKDLNHDVNNCGTCGNVCAAGKVCAGGTCQCPAGQTDCNGTCKTLSNDSNNCGACGNVCAVGASCVDSACLCPTGQSACSGVCKDLSQDLSNCGTCGNVCAVGASCIASTCRCPTAQMECHGSCTDVTTDADNCGVCDRSCPVACSAANCTEAKLSPWELLLPAPSSTMQRFAAGGTTVTDSSAMAHGPTDRRRSRSSA
jgi:hypothetical protein